MQANSRLMLTPQRRPIPPWVEDPAGPAPEEEDSVPSSPTNSVGTSFSCGSFRLATRALTPTVSAFFVRALAFMTWVGCYCVPWHPDTTFFLPSLNGRVRSSVCVCGWVGGWVGWVWMGVGACPMSLCMCMCMCAHVSMLVNM